MTGIEKAKLVIKNVAINVLLVLAFVLLIIGITILINSKPCEAKESESLGWFVDGVWYPFDPPRNPDGSVNQIALYELFKFDAIKMPVTIGWNNSQATATTNDDVDSDVQRIDPVIETEEDEPEDTEPEDDTTDEPEVSYTDPAYDGSEYGCDFVI